MTDSAACHSTDLGEVMASAEALAELRDLVNSLLHPVAPLEKMPMEAPDDPQPKTGFADESAALPDPANRSARGQKTADLLWNAAVTNEAPADELKGDEA